RLFSAQKAGFENWQTVLRLSRKEPYFLLETPFPADTSAALILKKRIDEKQRILAEGEEKKLIRVSATPDLNVFFFCPLKWLYKKIIGVEKLTMEAQLLDDASLGLLYHEILRDLFTRIRETDKAFNSRRLAEYFKWTEEITLAAAKNYPAFQGPLAVPLVMSQARAIIQKLKGLLKIESAYFDGYAAGDLEAPLSLAEGGTRLYGIVDRVSISPDGAPLIIDYKTGKTPTKADSTGTDGSPPKDFQMPLYIKLYEAKAGVPVEQACFFSINDHDLSAVIGSPGKKRGHAREDYQETMEAVDICIEQFANAVDSLNFVPPETDLEACSACDYRCLCRTTFTLNSGRFLKRSNTVGKNSRGDGYVN
ncbi:MAG: PD-(D/E)XK nuclease family protein, partial [Treponema sp.]|nr:PD-(D/E)XK nuclease family protein [Treponema sp.]